MSIWPLRSATRSGSLCSGRSAGRPGLRAAGRAAAVRLGVAETESAGQVAANWTRVQGFLMWALSRNSSGGRVTVARAMFAFAAAWR